MRQELVYTENIMRAWQTSAIDTQIFFEYYDGVMYMTTIVTPVCIIA